MKPLLFLDVDGVINVSPDTPNATYVGKFESLFPIHLPAGIKGRVARLKAVYEMVWATTWRVDAHPFYREHLGLAIEPWPWVQFSECKIPSVVDYAKGRPFAWVDDDAAWEFVRHPALKDKPGITIAPLWTEGLTDEHVAQLLVFAAEEPWKTA